MHDEKHIRVRKAITQFPCVTGVMSSADDHGEFIQICISKTSEEMTEDEHAAMVACAEGVRCEFSFAQSCGVLSVGDIKTGEAIVV